jgi:hypothetical protein
MNDIENNIDRFKEFVNFWKKGYRFAVFSYVSLKQKDSLPMIVAASIRLMPVLDASKIVVFTHDSKSVTAGITHWEIKDNPLSFLSFPRAAWERVENLARSGTSFRARHFHIKYLDAFG